MKLFAYGLLGMGSWGTLLAMYAVSGMPPAGLVVTAGVGFGGTVALLKAAELLNERREKELTKKMTAATSPEIP